MSSESILTLLTVPGAKHSKTLLDEWAELGIRVLPADDAREETASEISTAKGVVLTERPREPLPLFKATGEAGDEPRLLLVYGECIPCGAADELTAAYPQWGRPDFWSGLPAAGLWDKDTEIRLFSPDPMAGTEQLPRTWRVHTHWLSALDQSDLLIIGTPDPLIREIRLHELVKGMAKPIILDACSCFPLEETACCQIIYRTIGENTNVWEWN